VNEPAKRPRRRRGGRGRRPHQQGDQQPPQPAAAGEAAPPSDARPQRQDSRTGRSDRQSAPPGPPPGPTAGGGGGIQRAPGAADRPSRDAAPPRDGRSQRSSGPQRGGSQRDAGRGPREGRAPQRPATNDQRLARGPRVFEAPVPQDERSVELGAAFRETQIAMREARKALAKRKAEFDDEPQWMLDQLHETEQRFEAAATAWSEHLETTGRKVVRR
jgi:hypothetical protein